MPKIDLSNVEESTGEFERLVPGAYVLTITDVEQAKNGGDYALVVWDVAEGAHAGIYKGSEWPPKDVMSWSERALGILKHKLHVLADDNPGFDAEKAFQGDDWKAFEGKKFGAVLRNRLYTRNNGSTGEGIEIARWVRTTEVPELQKQFEENPDALPKPRDTRKKTAPAPAPVTSATAEVYDEDIPF